MLPGVNHALLAHAEPNPRTWAQAPHDVAPALLTCHLVRDPHTAEGLVQQTFFAVPGGPGRS